MEAEYIIRTGAQAWDWLAVVAIIISLGAFALSVFTFYWRDTHRGKLRIWFPRSQKSQSNEGIALYVEIVNRSHFDVRVVELYAEVGNGNRLQLPGPFGKNGPFPIDIEARRSARIELSPTCLFDTLGKRRLLIFARTATDNIISTDRTSKRILKEYVATIVTEESARYAEQVADTAKYHGLDEDE